MRDVCRYLAEEKGITLSPQQRAAVASTSPAVLLLAVPGSGKTTALVARTARLLLEEGADPRRILTVTFNREAARDLEARWGQLFGSSGLGHTAKDLQPVCPGAVIRDGKLLNGRQTRDGLAKWVESLGV